MKPAAILLCAGLLVGLAGCRSTSLAPEPTDPPDAALFPDKAAAYEGGYRDGFQAGILEGVMMVSGPGPER
jgi:hypothetical protein